MRLIDADALSKAMYDEAFENDESYNETNPMARWDSGLWIRYKMFENILKEAPTIEPKQGEWIPKEMWTEGVGMGEQYGRYYECSECHREYRGDMESCYNFCPNCGARMEGADDGRK